MQKGKNMMQKKQNMRKLTPTNEQLNLNIIFNTLSPLILGVKKGTKYVKIMYSFANTLENITADILDDKYLINYDTQELLYFTTENWEKIEDEKERLLHDRIILNKKLCSLNLEFNIQVNFVINKYLNLNPSLNKYFKLLPAAHIIDTNAPEPVIIKYNGPEIITKIICKNIEKKLFSSIKEANSNIPLINLANKIGGDIFIALWNICLSQKTIVEISEYISNLKPDEIEDLLKNEKKTTFSLESTYLFARFFDIPVDGLATIANDNDNEIFMIFNLLCLKETIYLYRTSPKTTFLKLEKTFVNFTDTQLIDIEKSVIQNKLDFAYITLGTTLIKILTVEKILETHTARLSKNNHDITTVSLINKQLCFNMSSSLPNFYRIPHLKPKRRNHYGYKVTLKEDVNTQHQNPYLTGRMLDEEIIENQMGYSKFCINVNFSLNFFTMLKSLLDLKTKEIVTNPEKLRFLSELYKIDFVALKNQFFKENPKLVVKLVKYALNFAKNHKFKPPKSCRALPQAEFLKLIYNKIYSYKYFLQDLFFQIIVSNTINSFEFAWFADARGRKNLKTSALNPQGYPLVRNFISFYNPTTLSELLNTVTGQDKENMKKKEFASLFINSPVPYFDTLDSNRNEFDWFTTPLKEGPYLTMKALFSTSYRENEFVDLLLEGNSFLNADEADCYLRYFGHNNNPTSHRRVFSALWAFLLERKLALPLPLQDMFNNREAIIKDISLHLNKQILSIYPEFPATLQLEGFVCTLVYATLDDVLKDIKLLKNVPLGDLFQYFALVQDFQGFLALPDTYQFQNFYSLDASSSGMQILAMLQKSLNLSSYCALTTPSNDLYTAAANYLETTSNNIQRIVNDCPSEQSELFLIKYNTWDEYHAILLRLKEFPAWFGSFTDQILKHVYLITAEQKKMLRPNRYHSDFTLVKCVIILNTFFNYSRTFNVHYDTLKKIIFTRSYPKANIMTLPYGSTSLGRKRQLKQKFIDLCIKKGIFPTNALLKDVVRINKIIEKILFNWIEQIIPESLTLLQITRELCSKRQFIAVKIFSPYFEYQYYPHTTVTMRIHFGRSVTAAMQHSKQKVPEQLKFRKRINNTIDYQKIRLSFVANFVQFCDATIISIFFALLAKIGNYRIRVFTIHDRFFIEPLFSMVLKPYVTDSYKQFYNLNLLETIFTEKAFAAFHAKLKKTSATVPLLEKDLNNNDFIKH